VEPAAVERGTSVALPEENSWHEIEASRKTIIKTRVLELLFFIIRIIIMLFVYYGN